MATLVSYAVPVAVLTVFGVLLAGLYTMWRGTSPSLSQNLMRWRVGLQFVAVCVAMLAIYLKRGF